MKISIQRVRYIALKEVNHILRDVRSLIIAILMPLIMTFLFGYAINLDIKNIKLAILDYDRSPESRLLASTFYNSGYFARPSQGADLTGIEFLFKRRIANAVLTIPPGFGSALGSRTEYQLGLLVDGADANLAAATSNYAEIVVSRFLKQRLPAGISTGGVKIHEHVLYNPDLKSSHFFVPGLIAVILMLISALLTSLTIAREKEMGTMEQLLTTPVTPTEIIAGKVIPYIALAVIDGVLVLGFAVFHFGVPVNGSLLLLILFGVIFVVAALSIGILISTIVTTQQVAMLATFLATMMPSVLLSGFVFEIRNMPRILQLITYIVPARYFITIIRSVMLKGSGLGVLWTQGAALAALTLILLTVAQRKFRIKVA